MLFACTGLRSSRSNRTTCCPCATTRVLRVVGRPSSTTIPAVSTPRLRTSVSSLLPVSSEPTTPAKYARPPAEQMLFRTFAHPPSMKLSFFTSTTGTGASGEIRETRPQMKWSAMISPTTRTPDRGNFSRSANAFTLFIIRPLGGQSPVFTARDAIIGCGVCQSFSRNGPSERPAGNGNIPY